MFDSTWHLVWLVGYLLYMFLVYGPSARRYRRTGVRKSSSRPLDIAMDMVTFIGWQILPLVYIFSDWLDFADFVLPGWAGWVGAMIFASALTLLYTAYRTLGKSWSPKIDIVQVQRMVTEGIYGRIRHPIYVGVLLWGISQPLLLHNWLAGFGLLATYLPLIALRLPREEKMMLEHFGAAYQDYMGRTGGLWPKF